MVPSYQKLLVLTIVSNYLNSEDSSLIVSSSGDPTSNSELPILFHLYFQQMKIVFQYLSLLFCQNNVIGEYSEFVNTHSEQVIKISEQISEFV